MHKIRGKSSRAGSAIGSAAIMRPPLYIPEVPSRYSAQLTRVRTDEPLEQLDVVLVCDTMSRVNGFAAAWANVVAIIVGDQDVESVRTNIPSLVVPVDLLSVIEDDVVILLDGQRQTAFVEPDPVLIAQFQSEHNKLSPRIRIFLDEQDQHAITVDRVRVNVAAYISSEDTSKAIQSGADFLYSVSPSHVYEILTSPVGKPITLQIDLNDLEIDILLQAAVLNDLTIVVPISDENLTMSSIHEEFENINEEMLSDDIIGSIPKFARKIDLLQEFNYDEMGTEATRIILDLEFSGIMDGEKAIEWIDYVARECISRGLKLEVIVQNGDLLEIEMALCFGATTVIVEPEYVQMVKGFANSLNLTEARQRHFSNNENNLQTGE